MVWQRQTSKRQQCDRVGVGASGRGGRGGRRCLGSRDRFFHLVQDGAVEPVGERLVDQGVPVAALHVDRVQALHLAVVGIAAVGRDGVVQRALLVHGVGAI